MRESLVGAEGLDGEAEPSAVPASSLFVVRQREREVTLLGQQRQRATSLLSQTEDLFLVSNISPDEKAFAADSLQAIAESLIPSIFEAHKLDQDLLHKEWRSFSYASMELDAGASELDAQRSYYESERQSHKQCRSQEQQLCEARGACEHEVEVEWKLVSRREEELMDTDGSIRSDWCGEELNFSTSMFRTKAYSSFDRYISRKAAIDEAMARYRDVVERCAPSQELAAVQRSECEHWQGKLELANCRLSEDADRLKVDFQESWSLAQRSYTDSAASVLKASENRKAEYSTILAARCLLEKMYEVTEPCENRTDDQAGAKAVVSACKNKEFNMTELAIHVNETPQVPLIPVVPPDTCSKEYVLQEYGGLSDCAAITTCMSCTGKPVDVSEFLTAAEDGEAGDEEAETLVDDAALAEEASDPASV